MLIWNDKLNAVRSNYGIAHKVTERITDKLAKNNQLEKYNKIFHNQ